MTICVEDSAEPSKKVSDTVIVTAVVECSEVEGCSDAEVEVSSDFNTGVSI